MSLIINRSIKKFQVGFPTESDKYNILGGILTGDKSVEFGELIKFSDVSGYYEGIASDEAITIDKIAGFILGTNVKLVDWESGKVYTNPGEAFNLTFHGTFLAVKLASSAVEANIKPNANVHVKLTGGEITTSGDADGTEWPAAVFTGEYETQDGRLVAEIYII